MAKLTVVKLSGILESFLFYGILGEVEIELNDELFEIREITQKKNGKKDGLVIHLKKRKVK